MTGVDERSFEILVDPERVRWLGNVPKRQRDAAAYLWAEAEVMGNETLLAYIVNWLMMSASDKNKRSEQMVEAMKGYRDRLRPAEAFLSPQYETSQPEKKKGGWGGK